MKGVTNSRLRAALACSSSLCFFAALPAYAQDGSEAAAPQPTPIAALDAAEEDSRIVVTGSRIVRRDYDSDSPIVTVSEELLENSGSVAIDDQLKELPQFIGGQGAVGPASGSGTSIAGRDVQALPTNSPGIATVDLRGLGTNRTLVLLDGRRMTPANASGVVDLNTIPRAAISGVEVITGGAASTYGADAVSGVVNFQLKRNFTGVDFDAQFGVTERGDGQTWDLSLLLGSDFADDRGNVMLGLNFADRGVVRDIDVPFLRRSFSDPDFTAGGNFIYFPGYTFLPTDNAVTFSYGNPTNFPSQAAIDSVFGRYGYAPGDVPTGANSDVFFNGDGTLFSALPGAVSGRPAPNFKGTLFPEHRLLSSGALAPNAYSSFTQVPLRRYSLFGHAYYEVADGVEVYIQGSFNQNEVQTQSFPTSMVQQWGVGITFDAATCGAASGHPVPGDLCELLRSRPNPDGPWQLEWPGTFLGPQRVDTTLTTYEVLAGVRGDLSFGDWTWDVFAAHGRTGQETNYNNFVVLDQAQKLISLPNYGAGAVFFNPRIGLDASCTSGLNPFNQNAMLSQDCRDIISPELHTESWLTQDQIELNAQGALFDLPGGEVRVAIGAAYRENDFEYSPDAAFRSDNINSITTGVFSVLPTSGEIDVKEIYGELLIPILQDLAFVQDFSINAGIRHSDYSTEGGVTTWKVTGDLSFTDWLKLRGGYQRANRAPNIAELFQPGTYQTVAWADHDPCSTLTTAAYGNVASNPDRAQVQALCNAIAGTNGVINNTYIGNVPRFFPLGRDFIVGNPDVESETAKSWTVGTVLRVPNAAPWLETLTLSVDYYNIKVEGAIQSASTQFVYEQCFNRNGESNPNYDPNNQFCQLINRDPTTGFWLSTVAEYQNLGKLATSGVDATLNWSVPVPGLFEDTGSLFLNVAFNWLEKFDLQATPGGVVNEYKGTNGFGSQFDWRLNSTVGYDFGRGQVSLNWRHLPEIQPVTANSLPVPDYDIFDLSGRFSINETVTMRLGVENLFDREPDPVGVVPGGNSNSGVTDFSAYDILGRRYYIGLKAEL